MRPTPRGTDMNAPVTPLVESRDVSVHYTRWVGSRRRTVYALDDFSIAVAPGETVGLVGESGCGKSTAGRALLGAVKPTKGQVIFEGRDVTDLSRRNWRAMRKNVQMIFQDPYSALNPKIKIRDSIAEPFLVHTRKRGAELDAAVGELLETVGMTAGAADKYPHAFSGGQRQRIVIARALALHPSFVVADEATAALDVSIQAQ
ncbi:MAG: ABC transporter ATP-binding protein, partial [Acidimicrobiaceae bacterium]|nr:ABC transporter ATP-binding protein [Acidimicrobiaceae bacterium]